MQNHPTLGRTCNEIASDGFYGCAWSGANLYARIRGVRKRLDAPSLHVGRHAALQQALWKAFSCSVLYAC